LRLFSRLHCISGYSHNKECKEIKKYKAFLSDCPLYNTEICSDYKISVRRYNLYLDFSFGFHFPSTNCDTQRAMFSISNVNLLLSICTQKDRKNVIISDSGLKKKEKHRAKIFCSRLQYTYSKG
jgi:hypothetical protein